MNVGFSSRLTLSHPQSHNELESGLLSICQVLMGVGGWGEHSGVVRSNSPPHK